jgi:hypothetical protein
MTYKHTKEQKNSLLFLVPQLPIIISPVNFLLLMLWTALFWIGIAPGDWLLWTGYWNVRVSCVTEIVLI